MFLARVTAWTLLVAGGFAFYSPSATGQNPLPKKNSAATAEATNYRDLKRGGIPKEELKKVRESFKTFAKYYADVVAHPDVWKAPQELKVGGPNVVSPPTLDGENGILRDIDRFIIEPGVTRTTNDEPNDYVRELGAAFDGVLKELIETHPDMIVRVNAARVLAHVARTGAPAHFPTVTALIANANTPPGVKNYLFNAAGALLAASDMNDLKVRRHAADAQTIGALVKALQDCIGDPAMLVPGVSLSKPETLTDDQLLVVGFLRRQAVRALGQTKFVRVPGPDGKSPLYPAFTLVRVAMSDPALVPAPGPTEAAEAVIGLCRMAPVEEQLKGGFRPIKEYNADVAVEAMAAAMVTFAGPRAANAFDKTVKWRTYAADIAEAMRNYRPLFDPDFEIAQPAKFNPALIPAVYEDFYKFVVPKILAPMDKVDFAGKPDIGATVDIQGLRERLNTLRARPKRNTQLFAGVPSTSIDFPPPKKEAPKTEVPPPKKEVPKAEVPPPKEPPKK
jgi:hypothetical protein